MLLFLVVLPVKSEYLMVKGRGRYQKGLSDGCYAFSFWCFHIAAPGPQCPLEHGCCGCGAVVALAHSPAPAWPLAHPPSVLWGRGENRKSKSEKACGQDKVWVIAYQLPLWAKHTWLKETSLVLNNINIIFVLVILPSARQWAAQGRSVVLLCCTFLLTFPLLWYGSSMGCSPFGNICSATEHLLLLWPWCLHCWLLLCFYFFFAHVVFFVLC